MGGGENVKEGAGGRRWVWLWHISVRIWTASVLATDRHHCLRHTRYYRTPIRSSSIESLIDDDLIGMRISSQILFQCRTESKALLKSNMTMSVERPPSRDLPQLSTDKTICVSQECPGQNPCCLGINILWDCKKLLIWENMMCFSSLQTDVVVYPIGVNRHQSSSIGPAANW